MSTNIWEPWKSIVMTDGGQLCLVSTGANGPLFDYNHNIFRLSKDGNVVWQVKRDEGAQVGWAKSRADAEARNDDDFWTRSPFTNLVLKYADGLTNMQPLSGLGPDTAAWVEGATVYCHTLDGKSYVLDIESGVAQLVFMPTRPW